MVNVMATTFFILAFVCGMGIGFYLGCHFTYQRLKQGIEKIIDG